MNLDLASFAFGANLSLGTGTSPWGTSLGQSQPDYKFTAKGYENILCGMVYNSVPLNTVGLPLGKGGNTVYCHENSGCQLAAGEEVVLKCEYSEESALIAVHKPHTFKGIGERDLELLQPVFAAIQTVYPQAEIVGEEQFIRIVF